MPRRRSTSKILHQAGELRKSPTQAEAKLWAHLRTLRKTGIHFRRQHAIGVYIVDFCAIKQRIIIELDGSQHKEKKEYDARRTAFLESKGYRVLRFWNNQVMSNIDGVGKTITQAIEEQYSLPSRPAHHEES